jgi:CheY-like chemotaxis protein
MFGYEVETAAHGLEAVEACATGAHDIVLMDCHMPVMGGLEATRRIRAAEGERRHVIIAVTGDGDRDECLAAGMDDHLLKPVRPGLLRATLARWRATSRSGTASPLPSQTPP